jgi:hypothetical protein
MSTKGRTGMGFCVLMLAFLVGMVPVAWAQEGICVLPTGTETVLYPPGWGTAVLEIYSSGETVNANNPISLWVDSDRHGCPPYEWQVDGEGYSLSKSTTIGDFDVTVLSVVGGTCGLNYDAYATITVADQCSATDAVIIRNTGGEWRAIDYRAETCPNNDGICGTGQVVYGEYIYHVTCSCWHLPYSTCPNLCDIPYPPCLENGYHLPGGPSQVLRCKWGCSTQGSPCPF